MRLVTRRARGAKALLFAAAGATLIGIVLLTGLVSYGRTVAAAGARNAIAAAPPEERSILLRGATGGTVASLAGRDAALRRRLADGLGGVPVRVSAAGYASGQLAGATEAARPDRSGLIFASIMFLDDLSEHSDLQRGRWPRPGATPAETAVAERAATILGVRVGDRIPVTDRRTGATSEFVVAGIWRPRNPTDAYWRLTPEVAEGVAPMSATYGPLVLDRADFLHRYAATASAGWLLAPDLVGADLATLVGVRDAVAAAGDELPDSIGLAGSGQVDSHFDRLVDRLRRAELVGRSALVTPVLLVAVLGGYALLLVAGLLAEHRGAESALLRARGAARGQLAGLALREAAVVVLPGALVAPLLVTGILGYADRTPVLAGHLRLGPEPAPYVWSIAAIVGACCVLAVIAPTLRRSGTYVAELAGRSRPTRSAVVQRAGVDIALTGFAVLAWVQLRQYATPLLGAGGRLDVDPLLAAAPTVGVLAGVVIALRLLPPATRFAERFVDRRSWTAATLGMWQAGRRPHAGPVLLLALAVAVSTLAWCLASTSQRSIDDQADFQVGADLRLTEATGLAPPGRGDEIAGLPGLRAAQGVWREAARYGAQNVPAQTVALDPNRAPGLVRVRDDLANGSAGGAFHRLAAARRAGPVVDLPTGAGRLTGRVSVLPDQVGADVGQLRSSAVVATAAGQYLDVPLGAVGAGAPMAFDVALPVGAGPLRLAGFVVSTVDGDPGGLTWRLSDLTATGTGTLVDLSVTHWRGVERARGDAQVVPAAGPGRLEVDRPARTGEGPAQRMRLGLVPAAAEAPVPVLATPAALDALRLREGETGKVELFGAATPVAVVGTLGAVPGVEEPAALLADLPSLAWRLFAEETVIRGYQEWWLATEAGQHERTAAAAGDLAGVAVLDRRAMASAATAEPYGVGARGGLLAASLGAVLLAAVGIWVEVRATARRRVAELAVLHTLGAGPRLLARALIAEQGLLAGMGVAVGLLVGLAVAAATAPLIVLSPTGDRPVPPAVLAVAWTPIALTAAGLMTIAVGMSGLEAATMRRRLAIARLRIGDER